MFFFHLNGRQVLIVHWEENERKDLINYRNYRMSSQVRSAIRTDSNTSLIEFLTSNNFNGAFQFKPSLNHIST